MTNLPKNSLSFSNPPALGTRSASVELFSSPRLKGTARSSPRSATPVVVAQPATTTTVSVTTMSDPGPSTSAPPATTMASTSNAAVSMPAGRFDTSFGPPSFHGQQHEDAGSWLSRFDKYATYRGFNDVEKRNFMAVLLKDDAADWLDSLDPATVTTWAQLRQVFEQRFKDSDLCRYQKAANLWRRVQGETESVDSYVTAMKKLAKSTAVEGDQLRFAIQQGLKPDILSQVIQRQPNSLDELLAVSRLAEAATAATTATRPATFERILAEVTASRQLAEQNAQQLQRMAKQPGNTNMINEVGPTTPRPPQPGRTQFMYSAPPQPRRSQGTQRPPWRQGMNSGARPSRPMNVQMTQLPSCNNCGGKHTVGREYCTAANVQCYCCGKIGHLQRFCRAARRPVAEYQSRMYGPQNSS